MVEFLIKAKDHWMESLTEKEVDKLSKEEKEGYDSRSQKGDIIVVKPDNWKWGKCECLPDFVVVKVPEMNMEDGAKYQDSLVEDSTDINGESYQKLLKRRKYFYDKTDVDSSVSSLSNSTELTKEVVLTKITEK